MNMYHIIKENGKDVLLCSGTMKDSDFAMFKSEFGIEKNQIRFIDQSVIQKYGNDSNKIVLKALHETISTLPSPVRWAIRCEDKYHTYSNYFVEANTEEEAWAEFMNIKHGVKSNSKNRYKNIVITPVK